MREVTLEQAAAFYGVELPAMHRIGSEVRMRCFLTCGRHGETGERAISIQPEHPAKVWRCFDAGCGRGGNLLSLCDLLKPGEHAGGKPRGERFKGIVHDLQAIVAGEGRGGQEAGAESEAAAVEPPRAKEGNVPLAKSPNERARSLVNLDAKFVTDPAAMIPKAAEYFRRRPYLTPEACRRWKIGYLPRDTGGDHGGGTMRGKIVFPVVSEESELLTWFGRDPEFEAKHHQWIAGGKQGKEPEKYHFVKGFERGRELFGQERLREEGVREKLEGVGLLVVKGPNDVVALDALGIPAVGLCGTGIAREQVEKVSRLGREVGGGIVTVMLDCNEVGTLAARQAVVALSELCPVRMAWSETMHGGAFKGRAADSLSREEWDEIRGVLVGGGSAGGR
jgi:hypothetical protein